MDARLKELTKEELEILNLACDGESSEEIAAVLGMTHGAFQKNAQAVNRKLGIENLPEAERKREIHRLCAAVADLQSGRGRSVVRRDPDFRKGIVAVADLLSQRDSSVVRPHDPVVRTHNQALEKVEIIDVTPWWKSRMVRTIFITAAFTAVAAVVYFALRGDLLAPTECPISSPINMVGQVASDTPGTPLQLCQAVTSVIDKRTRPIDVYFIQLQAGQSVKFRIQCNEFCSLSLWNPNTPNVRSTAVGANVFTVRSHNNREDSKAYTAAVDGTYPVSIRASRSSDRYIASVQPVQ